MLILTPFNQRSSHSLASVFAVSFTLDVFADRCQYEITCNPMESTYLEFICPSFELESSTDCLNDRLVVTYHGSREE